MTPVRWDPRATRIEDFEARHRVYRIVDEYESMLTELFQIRHPPLRFDASDNTACRRFIDDHRAGRPLVACGAWFYFPDTGLLVHYLPEIEHEELRTARNRLLITDDEQRALRDIRVGIAGLSVGSHAALTLTMMGGARGLRLADPDRISGSNLNRIRLDFSHVGRGKCDAVAGLIGQTDPYHPPAVFPEGLHPGNLEAFMTGLDVFVDCMDDLELKWRARQVANQLGLPVLMATDNGDGVILAVERHDLDPATEPFNGTVGGLSPAQIRQCPPAEKIRLATRIAGADLVHHRMLESVSRIGTELYAWPQLATAATLTGVVIAYAVRRLANQLPLPSGQTVLDPEAILDPDYHLPTRRQERQQRRALALAAMDLADLSEPSEPCEPSDLGDRSGGTGVEVPRGAWRTPGAST